MGQAQKTIIVLVAFAAFFWLAWIAPTWLPYFEWVVPIWENELFQIYSGIYALGLMLFGAGPAFTAHIYENAFNTDRAAGRVALWGIFTFSWPIILLVSLLFAAWREHKDARHEEKRNEN